MLGVYIVSLWEINHWSIRYCMNIKYMYNTVDKLIDSQVDSSTSKHSFNTEPWIQPIVCWSRVNWISNILTGREMFIRMKHYYTTSSQRSGRIWFIYKMRAPICVLQRLIMRNSVQRNTQYNSLWHLLKQNRSSIFYFHKKINTFWCWMD